MIVWFDSRIENSCCNIYTVFYATSIMKHVERIVAALMLNYCNICQSVRFCNIYERPVFGLNPSK